MKKIIFATLAILCTLSLLTACGNSETQTGTETAISTEEHSATHSFRNVDWGMTIDEVKAAETAELEAEKENKSLRYKNIEMFDQKFELVYAFSISKGLESAVYASPNLLDNEAAPLGESIISTLNEKYGKSEYEKGLNRYTWYSDDTRIELYIGTPQESENLTYFRVWYYFDDSSKRSDNGNL